MSTATGSAQSMRQQLDELDALLERMLTLPVNQLDDTPPPAPPPRRAEPPVRTPPRPTPAAPPAPATYSPPKMRLLTDAAPVPPPPETEPIGYERAFTLNLNPQHGSSVLGPRPMSIPSRPAAAESPPATALWRTDSLGYSTSPPVTAGPGGPVVSIEPLPVAPRAPMVAPGVSPSAALRPSPPRGPSTPLLLWPLVVFNKLFDGVLMLFGAPGEWLTSPVGKNLLGYSGLLMLGVGLAWGVLEWFGWTR